jgi:anti-anti-sigma factor
MYTITNVGKNYLVKLTGDLDTDQIPELQKALKDVVNGGALEIVFDFSDTKYLNSSGIGLLVATRNSLVAQKGTIRIVNVSADTMRMLQSIRLVNILNAAGKQ